MDNNIQPDGASPQVSPQYAPAPDEIDLLDILRILTDKKWLILGITILCTGIAIAIALLLPREYRAEVTMLPPLTETIEKLNVLDINGNFSDVDPYFFKVEIKELYDEFLRNLQSSQMQKQFFEDYALARFMQKKEDARPVEVIFKNEFRKKINFTGLNKKKKDREFVSISLKGRTPELIAVWLNDFVRFVDKETIVKITQSFAIKLQRTKGNVSRRIECLRSIEKSLRLDRIAQLEEAEVVAKTLGLVEHSGNLGGMQEAVNKDGMRMNLQFSLSDMPLYSRGSRVLQAEVNVLRQRKNDDPFIPGLRGLQERFNFLSSVRQDINNVHAMRLDQAAIAEERPIKPNRKLIVVFGFTLGILLAVFVVFIRNMILTVKQSFAQ